jgi:hypothetical protein
MSQTILVLTEEALQDADVKNLRTLQGEEDAEFVILIPVDRNKSVLGEFFRHLSLLEFGQAFRDVVGKDQAVEQPESTAHDALEASLRLADAAGLAARGYTVGDNAVEEFVRAAADENAVQAVVITRPHAMADTFHTDWANQAQGHLGIPVLHLYSGSGFIGGS